MRVDARREFDGLVVEELSWQLPFGPRTEAVLLRPTRTSIVRALRNVPAAPREAGEYGRIYNLLKAYLMTTTDAKKIELGQAVRAAEARRSSAS